MTRLQALLTTAAVLAGVAGGINYAYWRRAAAPGAAPRRWSAPGIAEGVGAADPRRGWESGQFLSLVQHLPQNPHDAPARLELAAIHLKRKEYSRSRAAPPRLRRDH